MICFCKSERTRKDAITEFVLAYERANKKATNEVHPESLLPSTWEVRIKEKSTPILTSKSIQLYNDSYNRSFGLTSDGKGKINITVISSLINRTALSELIGSMIENGKELLCTLSLRQMLEYLVQISLSKQGIQNEEIAFISKTDGSRPKLSTKVIGPFYFVDSNQFKELNPELWSAYLSFVKHIENNLDKYVKDKNVRIIEREVPKAFAVALRVFKTVTEKVKQIVRKQMRISQKDSSSLVANNSSVDIKQLTAIQNAIIERCISKLLRSYLILLMNYLSN